MDGDALGNGNLDSLYIADGCGLGGALYEGQRPVVSIVGDAQMDFGGRDFRQGIFHDLPDFVERSYGHGRAVRVSAYMI